MSQLTPPAPEANDKPYGWRIQHLIAILGVGPGVAHAHFRAVRETLLQLASKRPGPVPARVSHLDHRVERGRRQVGEAAEAQAVLESAENKEEAL
jgi:hypothetical protein